MNNKITVDTVTKYYKSTPAVYNASFTLDSGKIYGLLGPNGAGKSTLCSILSTAVLPDTGDVDFFGIQLSKCNQKKLADIRKGIGYLNQNPYIYPEMTVLEYLMFLGGAKGLKDDSLNNSINSVMDATDISELANRVNSTLSTGCLHRVAISGALIADPDFLILDEPSNSLDPEQNLLLRSIVAQRKADGRITVISSHNLYEIQNLCDSIIIIANGQIIKTGDISNFESTDTLKINITLSSECGGLLPVIRKLPDVISCKGSKNSMSLTVKSNCELERISSTITSNGGIIIGFTPTVPTLEDIYLKLISK